MATPRPRSGPRHAATPRPWLKRLHLWLGLSVGVMFALCGLSGSLLALQTPLLKAMHPPLAQHRLPDMAQQAAVLARIASRWVPAGAHAADLPSPALPVWQLYFDDGSRRYLDPADGHLLLLRDRDDPLLLIRAWHTHLLGGAIGQWLLGGIGLLVLALLGIGAVLWWPGRRRWRSALRFHSQPPVRRWFSWHRSLGALALPLLLLMAALGTMLAYHHGTQRLLSAALDTRPAPRPPHVAPERGAIDWLAVMRRARTALPGARLHRVMLPTTHEARVSFRAQAVGEMHPVGRSLIWIDPYRAQVLGSVDATRQGLGARLGQLIYPLHSGRTGSVLWHAVVCLAGLLPATLLITGLLFWRQRTRRRTPR